jgi:hypothetical protein
VKLVLALASAVLLLTACGSDDSTSTPTATSSPTPTASPTASPTPTLAPTPTPTPAPSTETPAPHIEPFGFPIDPNTHLGVVTGDVGSRRLIFDGSGAIAYNYAHDDQPSGDPERANRSGWNCDTHYEYESAPAEDFYIPDGTPIIATMDGTATLNIISTENDFDRYGVSREPYIGNPDRRRAPYSPFPGPSAGLGVYVHIENTDYVTEYGHLDVDKTVAIVPETAFVSGYSRATNYRQVFGGVPEPRLITQVAQWYVHAGDVIGMSGDAGYSEGPHLHYTVAHLGGPLRCPTNEAGYTDGGWLLR